VLNITRNIPVELAAKGCIFKENNTGLKITPPPSPRAELKNPAAREIMISFIT